MELSGYQLPLFPSNRCWKMGIFRYPVGHNYSPTIIQVWQGWAICPARESQREADCVPSPASSAPYLQGLESIFVTSVSLAKGFQIKRKEDVKMAKKKMKSGQHEPVALPFCSFCGLA